jgi:hypothetical protein
MLVASLLWWAFLPINWWIAGGLLLFCGGNTLMEYLSFLRNDKELRRLTGGLETDARLSSKA